MTSYFLGQNIAVNNPLSFDTSTNALSLLFDGTLTTNGSGQLGINLNSANVWAGLQTFNNINFMGENTSGTTPVSGALLYDNGSYWSRATLIAGAGISIGSDGLTISASGSSSGTDFQGTVTLEPTGTATSTQNYNSNQLVFESSIYNAGSSGTLDSPEGNGNSTSATATAYINGTQVSSVSVTTASSTSTTFTTVTENSISLEVEINIDGSVYSNTQTVSLSAGTATLYLNFIKQEEIDGVWVYYYTASISYPTPAAGTIILSGALFLDENGVLNTPEIITPNNVLDNGGEMTIAGIATFNSTAIFKGEVTFDAGITGTGNTGSLTAGSGITGSINTWSNTNTFSNNVTFNNAIHLLSKNFPNPSNVTGYADVTHTENFGYDAIYLGYTVTFPYYATVFFINTSNLPPSSSTNTDGYVDFQYISSPVIGMAAGYNFNITANTTSGGRLDFFWWQSQ